MDTLLGILGLAGVLAGYFLPALLAYARGHDQRFAIGMINLALGWTILGWFVALLWSITAIEPDGSSKPIWRRRKAAP